MPSFLSVQEAEERDFNPQAENALCFQEAQGAFQAACAKESPAIESVLAARRFAVVRLDEFYCRSTDAFVGHVRVLINDFATHDEAQAYAQDRSSEDNQLCVLPEVPALPVAPVVDDTGIPF